MADPLSITASIIAVAGAGARLATTLYTYSDTAFRADKSLKSIAQDVSLTSAVINELGGVLKEDDGPALCSDNAVRTARDTITSCREVFDEIDTALKHSLRGNSTSKPKVSALGRLVWPLKEQRMELIRSNLEKLKSTLTLMLQVLQYARTLLKDKSSSQVTEQRKQIEILAKINAESTQRYHRLLKALDKVDLGDANDASTDNGPVKTGSGFVAAAHFTLLAAQHPIPTAVPPRNTHIDKVIGHLEHAIAAIETATHELGETPHDDSKELHLCRNAIHGTKRRLELISAAQKPLKRLKTAAAAHMPPHRARSGAHKLQLPRFPEIAYDQSSPFPEFGGGHASYSVPPPETGLGLFDTSPFAPEPDHLSVHRDDGSMNLDPGAGGQHWLSDEMQSVGDHQKTQATSATFDGDLLTHHDLPTSEPQQSRLPEFMKGMAVDASITCEEFLPLALNKFKPSANTSDHTLVISYADGDRYLAKHERPAAIFHEILNKDSQARFVIRNEPMPTYSHTKLNHAPSGLWGSQQDPSMVEYSSRLQVEQSRRLRSISGQHKGPVKLSNSSERSAEAKPSAIPTLFKGFSVTQGTTCADLLSCALKKYNVEGSTHTHSLGIVTGSSVRVFSNLEKPLMVFQQLKQEGMKPKFMVLKLPTLPKGYTEPLHELHHSLYQPSSQYSTSGNPPPLESSRFAAPHAPQSEFPQPKERNSSHHASEGVTLGMGAFRRSSKTSSPPAKHQDDEMLRRIGTVNKRQLLPAEPKQSLQAKLAPRQSEDDEDIHPPSPAEPHRKERERKPYLAQPDTGSLFEPLTDPPAQENELQEAKDRARRQRSTIDMPFTEYATGKARVGASEYEESSDKPIQPLESPRADSKGAQAQSASHKGPRSIPRVKLPVPKVQGDSASTIKPRNSTPPAEYTPKRGRAFRLSNEGREKIAHMRAVGACPPCKKRRRRCDEATPCRACVFYFGGDASKRCRASTATIETHSSELPGNKDVGEVEKPGKFVKASVQARRVPLRQGNIGDAIDREKGKKTSLSEIEQLEPSNPVSMEAMQPQSPHISGESDGPMGQPSFTPLPSSPALSHALPHSISKQSEKMEQMPTEILPNVDQSHHGPEPADSVGDDTNLQKLLSRAEKSNGPEGMRLKRSRDTSATVSSRRRKAAGAGLAGAAVPGMVERVRSRSRSLGRRNHGKGGSSTAATGLGQAALAGLYENQKAEFDAEAQEVVGEAAHAEERSQILEHGVPPIWKAHAHQSPRSHALRDQKDRDDQRRGRSRASSSSSTRRHSTQRRGVKRETSPNEHRMGAHDDWVQASECASFDFNRESGACLPPQWDDYVEKLHDDAYNEARAESRHEESAHQLLDYREQLRLQKDDPDIEYSDEELKNADEEEVDTKMKDEEKVEADANNVADDLLRQWTTVRV